MRSEDRHLSVTYLATAQAREGGQRSAFLYRASTKVFQKGHTPSDKLVRFPVSPHTDLSSHDPFHRNPESCIVLLWCPVSVPRATPSGWVGVELAASFLVSDKPAPHVTSRSMPRRARPLLTAEPLGLFNIEIHARSILRLQ